LKALALISVRVVEEVEQLDGRSKAF